MKRLIKSVAMWVACMFAPCVVMANALATDHKTMLYKLLGLPDEATDDMVNTKYTEAMSADAGDEGKKVLDLEKEKKIANEARAAAETLAANEKTATATEKARADKAVTDFNTEKARADKAVTDFANERKARVALLLDTAIAHNKITKADRTTLETEFANEGAFDATLAKLNAKTGTLLPGTRQTGTNQLGQRQGGALTLEGKQRQDKIAQMVNEEMAKPIYGNLSSDRKYPKAFSAVQAAHPELWANG